MKKICVVTGSRAEFGLLKWVMRGIIDSTKLQLQLLVTGMHLSPEFGLTVREIEAEGFPVDRKVEMLLSSDTAVGVTKSIGLAVIGFADALSDLQPDLLLVLGDRYEILAAATAALIARIPVAHLHGGETTEGAFDESIRHCITKMAHLHFVAAEDYRRRVIQLGENPEHVFLVGGLGIDSILRLELINKTTLEESLNFRFGLRNLLITFHPATLDDSSSSQIAELLDALESLAETHLIFTMPNSDPAGKAISRQIEGFVAQHPNAWAFQSLGQSRYLSCLAHVDAVVGNSSSGLIEAPSFRKATINVGDRQKGRLRAKSVIDCAAEKSAILDALQQVYSDEFQKAIENVQNPYGQGGASEAVIEILERMDWDRLQKKRFYDLSPLNSDFQAKYRNG